MQRGVEGVVSRERKRKKICIINEVHVMSRQRWLNAEIFRTLFMKVNMVGIENMMW